jgi:hypothetical protein
MAEFLDTTGVSYHLEQIIKRANERLVLISPYLKMNRRIKEFLEDRDRLKIDVRVIYGKSELLPDEINWLKSKEFIKTSYCENLHAKCYLNENEALLTSMNLYDFSQANNNEMGIYVVRSEEPELYNAIYAEVGRLIRISQEVKVSVEKVAPKESNNKNNPVKERNFRPESNKADGAFCISCKTSLSLDPTHPLCKSCYGKWKQIGDEDHEEKYCHICGKANKSTINKPVCYDCYRKHKELFSV